MNRIVINGVSFEAIDTLGGSLTASHAMVGESLAADTVEFTVIDRTEPLQDSTGEHLETVDGEFLYCLRLGSIVYNLRPGEEVFYYVDGALYAKFYLDSVEQLTKNSWKLRCTSVVGKLIASEHLGGMYDQTQASVILADLLAGLPYTVDEAIASATVKGYLPIGNRRDNLKKLLLVTGGSVSIDNTGKIRIGTMSSSPVGTFNRDNVFSDGRVKDGEIVKGLQLVEHNYIPNNETTVLFDDGVNGSETIRFNEPYHDLSIDGGTITERGANFAKVSGYGHITLTGKRYTHVTRVINVGDTTATGTNKVIPVTDETLANPQIAQELAERMFAYKQYQKTIVQDVVLNTQRAGDVVNVINPFTSGMSVATIKSLNIKMSGKNRAAAEFVLNYVPNGSISGFTQHQLLTGSGTFTVPANVTKLRAIICGAGAGGGAGKNGQSGTEGHWDGADGEYKTLTPGVGGNGGEEGKRGDGGAVFEINIDVKPGDKIPYACGVAGIAGTAEGQEGTAGTETTFGTYSSEVGRRYTDGYYEPKTKLTIGKSGEPGARGGKGGNATNKVSRREPYYYADDGEDVGEWKGAKGGRSTITYSGPDDRISTTIYASGGGGAAKGTNATGINGANAAPVENASSYGCGGHAGSGGGGGGGGGGSETDNAIGPGNPTSYRVSTPGKGGKFSAGSNGSDGCIILYY